MTTDPRVEGTTEPGQRLVNPWGSGYGDVAGRLLSSGVRCFAVSGFHATTTRDITQAAGLSSAALYVHFRSKEELLFEISRASHRSSLENLTLIPVGGGPESRLRVLVERFVAWHARHHVAARVSQYELAALADKHYAEVADIRRRTTELFRETVADGMRLGVFAAGDVMRIVRAILSLGIDLVRWYDLDGTDTPEELGSFYADLALAMVRPTPGESTTTG